MTWKPYDPATLLADGTVVYENPAGHWMPSTHTADALRDPTRFRTA